MTRSRRRARWLPPASPRRPLLRRLPPRLLLPGESDLLGLHRRDDGHISLEWRYLAGEIRMVAPADSILELSGTAITKAGVTLYLMDLIRDSVPDNVTEVRVVLRHEAGIGAFDVRADDVFAAPPPSGSSVASLDVLKAARSPQGKCPPAPTEPSFKKTRTRLAERPVNARPAADA